MKKLLAILVAGFALVACSHNDNSTEATASAVEASAPTAPAAAQQAPQASAPAASAQASSAPQASH